MTITASTTTWIFSAADMRAQRPQGEAAILTLARTEGIVLEHIYTAKTFACFLDLARRHVFPEGEPVCVIHTGGVPALFSQFEEFRTVRV